jgi:hypothetical protein
MAPIEQDQPKKLESKTLEEQIDFMLNPTILATESSLLNHRNPLAYHSSTGRSPHGTGAAAGCTCTHWRQ